MVEVAELDELIIRGIQGLSEKEKREVLNFIGFLRIREEKSFIEYVNKRTKEAKKRGEHFPSLEELQREYA